MLQYYIDFWKNYVNFSGRSRRAAYWYVVLINIIIGVVLNSLAVAVPVLVVLAYLYDLATLIPSIALCVRRLHDIGKRGWWWLLVFVPLVGAVVLIYWFAQEGDRHGNAYGPDPKMLQGK